MAYAESMIALVVNDIPRSIECLRRSHELFPIYAPAILGLGSVEYQLGHVAKGRKLLFSLLDLPETTPDLRESIDLAGDFLIQGQRYGEGLALYRQAAARFPRHAAFHQGVGCCAGHERLHEEAVAASREAVRLHPNAQQLVNDLGWTLYEAGFIEEAVRTLERAVALDPDDELAAGNLRLCKSKLAKSRTRRPVSGPRPKAARSPSRRSPAATTNRVRS
jgi:tetratricopeptide (TPR) repeat protein